MVVDVEAPGMRRAPPKEQVSNVIRTSADATQGAGGIRLDLAPLLSLYGRNRRLSLRVERLPERARLSRGRNNGDRSWSVTREDLDDLRYLPPEGMKAAHTLAIRIINLDTEDGATLAVLDFAVPAASDAQVETAELERSRSECAQARAALSQRECELAEVQKELARLRAEVARQNDAIAAAVQIDSAELEKLRKESVQAKTILGARERELAEAQRSLARFRAEVSRQEDAIAAAAHIDTAELERLREECARVKVTLGARDRELAETRQSLARSRADTSRQEDVLAAARAAWQIELDDRLAESRAEAESKIETSRHTWQTELNAQIGAARARWQQEAEAALIRAKEAWKVEEAARLVQTEAQWREHSAVIAAEARARVERTESALARAEAEATRLSDDGAVLRRLRGELAEAQASLNARVRELAAARQSVEEARAESLKGKAEFAAAQAAWQSELKQRLSEVRAELEADRPLPAMDDDVQSRIDVARAQWRQELEVAMLRAREAWKSEEVVRLARAEAQWREQSAQTAAESAARVERAEAALARAQAHALQESADTAELRRVREELTEVRTVLLDREARLSQARQEMKRARERWKVEADLALTNAQEAWKAEEAYRISIARGDWQKDFRAANDDREIEEEDRARTMRRFMLDGFVAAALAVAVVVLYPSFAPMLAAYWPDVFGQPSLNASVDASPRQPPHPAPPPPPPPHIDIAIHGANVRDMPSATGTILTTLARGTKVALLEQKGSWAHVQIGNGDQKQQGWVYAAYLKDAPGP